MNNKNDEIKVLEKLSEISNDISNHDQFMFRNVIKVKSGKEMLQLKDFVLKDLITLICNEFIIEYNKNSFKMIENYEKSGSKVPKRINEFGNMIERLLKDFIIEKDKSFINMPLQYETGYPDIAFKRNKDNIYIEVKTLAEGTSKSSFRSFYYSYGSSNKINENGYHILVAFETSKEMSVYKTIQNPKGVKLPTSLVRLHIKDIYDLSVKLKMEFNTGNNGLYSDEEK